MLLFGAGAAGERLARAIAARGWARAGVFASPSSARLLDQVGIRPAVVFDRVRDHAPIADTEGYAAELAGSGVDVLVALGGGKVVDTAKGVAILLAEGGRLEEHCSVFRAPNHFAQRQLAKPKLPFVAVPTTLSGAEVTPGGGGRNQAGVKRTFWDARLAAKIAAYDPAMLASTPAPTLRASGMNALAHCVEGLYSNGRNPVSTAFALRGATLLVGGLRELDADRMGAGAALAGLTIANARVAIHHAMCHVISRLGVRHADANSVVLPHAMRFNLDVTRDEQEAFAAAIGAPAGDPPAAVERLQKELGVPSRLRDLGVEREQLPGLAEELMNERGLYFNPRPVSSAAEVLPVFEAAWG